MEKRKIENNVLRESKVFFSHRHPLTQREKQSKIRKIMDILDLYTISLCMCEKIYISVKKFLERNWNCI